MDEIEYDGRELKKMEKLRNERVSKRESIRRMIEKRKVEEEMR
jgi:hypothetical protein